MPLHPGPQLRDRFALSQKATFSEMIAAGTKILTSSAASVWERRAKEKNNPWESVRFAGDNLLSAEQKVKIFSRKWK